MATQSPDYDTYGIPDPNELLSEQQSAYAQEMARAPNTMARSIISGIGGLQNFNGGGAQMQTAQAVQERMREILAQTNQDAPQDEDPLSKQMRIAQAMQQGLINVSPKAAMAAGDQVVKLAQAKQQQSLLTTKQQEEEQQIEKQKYEFNIEKNTPHMVYLAQDQGTDSNGLALGYKQLKSFDVTDPQAGTQMRAAMQAAQDNGQKVEVLNEDQMMQMRLKVAQDNYAKTIQAAMIRAQNSGQGSNSMNDRFTDRVFSGADMAIGGLESISRMPMGTSRGWFVDGQMSKAGESLFNLTGQNIRNALTNTDSQLYNTFTAGLGNNLAAVETQGLGQGLQQLAARLQDKIQIKPGDSPISIMGKLAEARDTIDRGLAVKLADPKVAPTKREEMQAMLERLHTAIPFTRNDVVAFDRASQADPNLTFNQYAATHELGKASAIAAADAATADQAPQYRDKNGTPAKASF